MVQSFKDLEKRLNGKISLAMKFTQQQIYKIIQKHIRDYYKEKVFTDYFGNKSAIPNVYKRTYQFLNSLIKTEVISNKNGVSCSVMINTDAMDYYQSGEVAVDMINRGFHSDPSLKGKGSGYDNPPYIPAKSNFWDDSMEELGGVDGIIEIFKENCKKVGIPITV